MATDIMTKACKATDDLEAQNRLGLKAFLSAVPPSIGKELRRKHLTTVRQALEEARFLKRVEEEEESHKVLTLEKKEDPLPQKDLIAECIKQLQDKGLLGERRGRPAGRKLRCWCCGQEGHFLMQCPTIIQNRTQQVAPAKTQQGNE